MAVHRVALLAVTAAMLLALVACADGGEDSGSDVEVGDAGEVPASVESEAQVVSIELYDGHIQMPATIDSNIRSFRLLNLGKDNHSLAIRGEGVDLRFSDEVGPENEKVFTIDDGLAPGSYEFYCLLEGHEGNGESATINVQTE